ncbi:MAG: macro domain-containing protein [Candidatus Spechtbacterales bacterium]
MIKHIRGDISKIDADIIVNSADTKLNHSNGGISKVIAEAAGYLLVAESKALKQIPLGEIGMTRAGNLKAKNVYHIPTIDVEEGTTISYEDLEAVWRRALTWCKANQFDSIATPLLGSDCGLDPAKVKEVLVKVGSEYQFGNLEIIIVEHEGVE